MSQSLLEVDGLRVEFAPRNVGPFSRREPYVAVDDITFTVNKGEVFGIVGESGAGKTTLLRSMVGLVRPTGGTVRYEGRDVSRLGGRGLKEYRRNVHVIFQNPYSAFHPRMKVGQSLEEPLRIHHIGTREQRRKRIADSLQAVGLDAAFVSRYPHQFSGGQRQRLTLARALVLGSSVILADEPVSALDVSIQAQVLNLFKDLQASRGLTYVVVAHDLAVVRYLCDRVAVMLKGRFVEVGPSHAVFANPMHPYTRALLAAIPTIRRGVRGEPLAEPGAAAFESQFGPMTQVDEGHFAAMTRS